jgi:hypothetical protein
MISKKPMQSISYIVPLFIFVIVFMFASIRNVHAAPIPCQNPDSSNTCGLTASYSMNARCTMSGSDKEPNGTRILGNQVCSLFGTDQGGLYQDSSGNPQTYTTATPPGWTYAKSGTLKGNITTAEFQDDPYYNIRFFGGSATVSQPKADDETVFRVGNQYTYWTGCTCGGTSVYNSSCPSSTFVGNTSVNIQPGDTIDFTVKNLCRPNNGYGQWGGGDAYLALDQATWCFTSNYLTWLNNNGYSYQNVVDYHPTAAGVCTPESLPPPPAVPTLKVIWSENNGTSINKTVTAGQSVTIPFTFSNIGQVGSTINVQTCPPTGPSGWGVSTQPCSTTLQAENP